MGKLKKLYEKAGGKECLKRYWKAGVLPLVGFEALLLGFSKPSLEIIRDIVDLKVQRKLQKKYGHLCDGIKTEGLAHNTSNKVWVLWLQGMDNAPALVQDCYRSLQENLTDKEIILLTEDNYRDYVTFPQHVQSKIDSGVITKTHFSDLLRLELLLNHGGTWIDATVLCTGSDYPKEQFEADLFMYQELKPGKDGHANFVSSWFMSAKTNNPILLATREMIYAYWAKNKSMVDYFLIHQFICIAAAYFPKEWNKVPQMDSSTPHILLLKLFEEYSEEELKRICNMTCFHKLTYKFGEEDKNKNNTYYSHIFGGK